MIAVVGAGIGGLSAAIEAAILGHEVTVFEAREAPGGKACPIFEHGYSLDPGPSIIILPEIYTKLLARAGIEPGQFLEFHRAEPATRLFCQPMGKTGGVEKVDLPSNWEGLLAVAESIEREDARNLAQIIEVLEKWRPYIEKKFLEDSIESPLGLLDWRLFKFGQEMGLGKSYKDLVDARFKSPLFRALFYGFPSYSGLTYRTKSPSPWFIPYFMLKEGIHVAAGGVKSIPAALEAVARKMGVKFQYSDSVIGVKWEANHVTKVETEQGGMVKVDGVIGAIDHAQIQEMLGRPQKYTPSMSYMTLHLGVKNPPEGLASHNLLIGREFESGFTGLYDRQDAPNWGVTYINAPHIDNPDCSPTDCGQLFFVTPCPAVVESFDWKQEELGLKEKLIDLVESFGMGLDQADIEVEIIQSPETFRSRDGNVLGSLFGQAESSRFFGMLPGLKDRQFSNLVYCGASVQPGAGMPMACLGGQRSAQILDRALSGR